MDKFHYHIFSACIVKGLHALGVASIHTLSNALEHAVLLCPILWQNRRLAIKVFSAHIERATDEIAPAVGQIGIVNLLHALKRNC